MPRSVFEYYSLRSQGLIHARADEEWTDKTSGFAFFGCCFGARTSQDASALAEVGELTVRVRFGDVDWRGGIGAEMARENCGCVTPPFIVKRTKGTGGKGGERGGKYVRVYNT